MISIIPKNKKTLILDFSEIFRFLKPKNLGFLKPFSSPGIVYSISVWVFSVCTI